MKLNDFVSSFYFSLDFRDWYKLVMDEDMLQMKNGIFFALVGGLVILLFTSKNPPKNDSPKIDEEHERALLSAVTYHRSPPPSKGSYDSMGENNQIFNIDKMSDTLPPPPRNSLLFSLPHPKQSTPSKSASTQNGNHSSSVDDIYYQSSQKPTHKHIIASQNLSNNSPRNNEFFQSTQGSTSSYSASIQNRNQYNVERGKYHHRSVPSNVVSPPPWNNNRLLSGNQDRGSLQEVSKQGRDQTSSEEDIYLETMTPNALFQSKNTSMKFI